MMQPVDRALVTRKLSVIATNVRHLEHVVNLTLDEYRSDAFRRKGIERLLQEIVDAAADANQHLLRESGAAPASDYRSSFIAVGQNGIIPAALAESLAPSAGLRNRLVHEYDTIDDAVVLGSLKRAVSEFTAYVEAVERYLGRVA